MSTCVRIIYIFLVWRQVHIYIPTYIHTHIYTRALEIEKRLLAKEQVLVWRQGEIHNTLRHIHTNIYIHTHVYSRALEIEKRTLGEEHVLVAKTKNNMGEALRIEGKYEEALQVRVYVCVCCVCDEHEHAAWSKP